MSNTTHYLTSIQAARHTSESLVELADQLPADVVARQLAGAKRNLAAGLAALAALPAHPLRGGALVDEMTARAEAAIATLEAR